MTKPRELSTFYWVFVGFCADIRWEITFFILYEKIHVISLMRFREILRKNQVFSKKVEKISKSDQF